MHARQVVKTLLRGLTVTLLLAAVTSSEECGTRFTDFTSSVVLAEVVIQGVVRELKTIPSAPGLYSATISVSSIYKGMEFLKTSQRTNTQGTVDVLFFGPENKESCVASAGDDVRGKEMVYFLRQSTENEGMMEHSALPVTAEGDEEAKVERSLCETCIRPPVIARIVCKDCAHEPTIKPLKSRKVTLGRRARLRCSSRGNPRPRIEWFKGQIPISDGNAGITITTSSSSSTLMFSSVTLAHAGQYTCVATNEVGVANGVVSLEVTRKSKQSRKLPSPHRSVKDSPDKVVCQANPCNNGGTCYFSPSLNLRQCVCQSGFEGVTCENVISSADIQRTSSSVATTNEGSMASSSVTANSSTTDAPTRGYGDRRESKITPKSGGHNVSHNDHHMHQIEKAMKMNLTKTTMITDNALNENASAVFAEVTLSKPKATQTFQVDRVSTSSTFSLNSSPTTSSSTSLKPIHASSSNGTRKPENRKSSLRIVSCKDEKYCLNNGRCKYIRQLDKTYCQCGQGFGGKRCEIRLNHQKHSSKDEEEFETTAKTTRLLGQSSNHENGTRIVACKSNPCLHGGTCYYDPSLNSETCLCSLGFRGKYCDIKTYFKSSYRSQANIQNNKLAKTPIVNKTKESSTQQASTSHITTTLPKRKMVMLQLSNGNKNAFIENLTTPSKFEATTQTSTTHLNGDDKTPDDETKSNSTPTKRIVPINHNVTAAADHVTTRPSSSRHRASHNVKKSKPRNISGGERLSGFPVKRKNSLKIIPCREKHYCNHGGKCRFIRKLNLKYCQCRKGYGGKRCELTLNFG